MRGYITCMEYDSLISACSFLCIFSYCIMFLCSKVAEAHVPSFILDEFRTIL